jgi:hypothetical protein
MRRSEVRKWEIRCAGHLSEPGVSVVTGSSKLVSGRGSFY